MKYQTGVGRVALWEKLEREHLRKKVGSVVWQMPGSGPHRPWLALFPEARPLTSQSHFLRKGHPRGTSQFPKPFLILRV